MAQSTEDLPRPATSTPAAMLSVWVAIAGLAIIIGCGYVQQRQEAAVQTEKQVNDAAMIAELRLSVKELDHNLNAIDKHFEGLEKQMIQLNEQLFISQEKPPKH